MPHVADLRTYVIITVEGNGRGYTNALKKLGINIAAGFWLGLYISFAYKMTPEQQYVVINNGRRCFE